jgi:hypothetical protein
VDPLTLSIAGLRVRLRVTGPLDEARFRHRFGAYARLTPDGYDAHLRVHIQRTGPLVEVDAPYPGVKVYSNPEGDKFLREGLMLWVDRALAAEARVIGPDKFPPLPHDEDAGHADTPLRILTSLGLLRTGRGALFHASGYLDERGAVLFAGPSGAGKTTLARLLPARGVLSDDQVALELSADGQYHLASTPFVGMLGRTIPPCRGPLRAIVLLDRTRTGSLTLVPPAAALAPLLGCLPLYARQPADARRALQLLSGLVAAVPVLRGSPDLAEGAGPWLDRLPAIPRSPRSFTPTPP